MIIFGSNSYALKSYNLKSLGIKTEKDKTMFIEYRQKYGHVFYIPCFPLHRFWALNSGGKLYEPPVELTPVINELDIKTKNGIWAWSGPLLLVLYLLYNGYSHKALASHAQDRRDASISAINTFLADRTKTTPLLQEVQNIHAITDSAYAAAKYEDDNVDTSFSGMLKLFMAARQTRKDSLTGYDESNTVIYNNINHKRDTAVLLEKNVMGSLIDGRWVDYGTVDTSSVFQAIRKLSRYKYVLFLSEYNRVNPVTEGKSFLQGFSLVNAGIVNIASRKVEKRFKVFAGNSDSVSHYVTVFQGEAVNNSPHDKEYVLNQDLKNNVIKSAKKYVFNTPGTSLF